MKYINYLLYTVAVCAVRRSYMGCCKPATQGSGAVLSGKTVQLVGTKDPTS